MSEKKFLKKKKDKQKQEVKLVSQKKMNIMFIGGFLVIVFLGVGTIVANATNTFIPKTSEKVVKQVNVQPQDNRLDMFMSEYINAYFNFDGQNTMDYQSKLNDFYATPPVSKSQGQHITFMELLSYRLDHVEGETAYYRVKYNSGEQQKQEKTVLFCVPFVQKDGKYYVKSLPHFEAIENLKAKGKEKVAQLDAMDGYSESEKKPLMSFLKLFFDNYTSNQDNLDIIAKDVRAMSDMEFKSIDYTYFVKDGDKIKAYVQATFVIADNTHSEDFTFTLVEKDDSFYVEKLDHVIPSDYVKNKKE